MRLASVRPLGLAAVCAALLFAAPAHAQTPTPAPAAPRSPVPALRNKLSAGDLASAEAIAEVWRAQHGNDGPWLVSESWLARGALLMGDLDRATRYDDSTFVWCASRLAAGADLASDDDLETALGAAIEVRAQLLAKLHGAPVAVAYLRSQLDSLAGPVSLTSRVRKRLHLLTLAGKPAPAITPGDVVRGEAPSLGALRGRPVLLFLFNYSCGDCKGSAATLAQLHERHADDGLAFVAITRWYDDEAHRAEERAAIDSTWSAVYAGLGDTPVLVSPATMESYGVSSTPTFVFIDRRGIVRRYAPTRLTESEFERAIAEIVR